MSVIQVLPVGTKTTRIIHAMAASMRMTASGDVSSAAAARYAERWRDLPSVGKALEFWETKAAVAAGTTTDSSFAGPLAQYGVASDAAELLRDSSVADLLLSRARRAPLNVSVPRETGAAAADWVGEGKPVPVRAGAYASVSLLPYRAGSIVILSRELAMVAHVDAEAAVRASIAASLSAFLGRQLLDNTVAASAGVRPASLTFAGTKVTSTGATSAAITADLAALLAGITTSQASLVWIAKPTTFARIALALPGALENGRLLGIPIVANGDSPQQLTLLDAGEVLLALPPEGLDLDISRHASLEFNDAPADPTVAATITPSLWQRDLLGIRISRLVSWWAPAGASSSMVTTY
ncbi:MAG: phage major capsid protein [Vicinamibacterales bacterium]